jgi:hypothetical protein
MVWSPIGLFVLAANFPLNVFVTISNKAFFRVLEFRWPVTLAAVHMLFCALIPFLVMRSGLSREKPPQNLTSIQKKREWLLAFVWALHIAMSNIGLRSVSVHLFVVVKCAGPCASSLLQWLMMGRKTSRRSLVALSLLVLGPALAVHSEIEATAFGVAATVAVVLLTSLKVVLSTLLFSGNKQKQWDSLPLLGEMSPKACILLLPWAAYEIWSSFNEGTAALTPPSQFVTGRMLLLLSGSGVSAFLLNYNNFLIFKFMDSPVAVAVFTNLRKVLTILASIVLFEQGGIEWLNVAGMVITFVGVALYTLYEMQEKKQQNLKKNARGENIV